MVCAVQQTQDSRLTIRKSLTSDKVTRRCQASLSTVMHPTVEHRHQSGQDRRGRDSRHFATFTSCRAGSAIQFMPCWPHHRRAPGAVPTAAHCAPPWPATPEASHATETLHFKTRAWRSSFLTMTRAISSSRAAMGVKTTAREGWIKLEGEQDASTRQTAFLCSRIQLKPAHQCQSRFSHALNIVRMRHFHFKRHSDDRINLRKKTGRHRPRLSGRRNIWMRFATTIDLLASGPPHRQDLFGRRRWPWRRYDEGKVSRIILTRPRSSGGSVGFLPGDLYEKILPYLRPLHDALHDMMPARKCKNYRASCHRNRAVGLHARANLNNAFII